MGRKGKALQEMKPDRIAYVLSFHSESNPGMWKSLKKQN